MKRRFPGLSQAALPISEVPDGLYLVRIERMQYRWDKQKPYYAVRFTVCEPKAFIDISLLRASTARPKRCGSSLGFCGILAMTLNCWAAMSWMRNVSLDSRAWSRSRMPP